MEFGRRNSPSWQYEVKHARPSQTRPHPPGVRGVGAGGIGVGVHVRVTVRLGDAVPEGVGEVDEVSIGVGEGVYVAQVQRQPDEPRSQSEAPEIEG